MGVATAISGGLGVVGGLAQTLQGARQEKEASRALANYERQQLTNVANNLEVSTLGADIQREEQSRLASSQIDALRGGGTRALLGGLGRVEAGNQAVNRQIAADIDMQQKQIQQQQAEDEARIRAMRENRENADVAALSSQVQAGRQDMWGGIGNMVRGVGMTGQAIGQMGQNPNASATTQGGYSTSGQPMNISNQGMTDTSMRFAPESGYANQPILTNPAYNPMNFGPQLPAYPNVRFPQTSYLAQ
jgi:hypothetical protein